MQQRARRGLAGDGSRPCFRDPLERSRAAKNHELGHEG